MLVEAVSDWYMSRRVRLRPVFAELVSTATVNWGYGVLELVQHLSEYLKIHFLQPATSHLLRSYPNNPSRTFAGMNALTMGAILICARDFAPVCLAPTFFAIITLPQSSDILYVSRGKTTLYRNL